MNNIAESSIFSSISIYPRKIARLKRKLRKVTELYHRISSERLVYIDLWCEVPIELRMEIHERKEVKYNRDTLLSDFERFKDKAGIIISDLTQANYKCVREIEELQKTIKHMENSSIVQNEKEQKLKESVSILTEEIEYLTKCLETAIH